MTAFKPWVSHAAQIWNGRNPPDLAVREGDRGGRLRGISAHIASAWRSAARRRKPKAVSGRRGRKRLSPSLPPTNHSAGNVRYPWVSRRCRKLYPCLATPIEERGDGIVSAGFANGHAGVGG